MSKLFDISGVILKNHFLNYGTRYRFMFYDTNKTFYTLYKINRIIRRISQSLYYD